jgi:hypothetical protein
MGVDLGSMNRFVTASAPAGAARHECGMVEIADVKLPSDALLLEVALEAEVLVARNQHLLVDAAMRIVAGGATFANGFMLEDKRAALRGMTFEAGLVSGSQGGRAALDHPAFMRVVAITATHLAVFQWMVIGEAEAAAFIQMTLETCLGVAARIDDGMGLATRLIVDAGRAVAGFAADVLGVRAFRHQAGVVSRLELSGDLLMALLATLGAHKSRARNLRRCQHRAGEGAARDGHGRQRNRNQHHDGAPPMLPQPVSDANHTQNIRISFHVIWIV